jgi:hypothetical protein
MILIRGLAGQRIGIYLVDVTDWTTAETDISFTPQYSKNGGAWTNFTNARVQVGNGYYYVEPTTTEVNTDGAFAIRVSNASVRLYFAEHEVRALMQAADVKTQVVAALSTDTYSEVSPGVWPASNNLAGMIRRLYVNSRNKENVDSNTNIRTVFADDGVTVLYRWSYSDTGGITTKQEVTS